MYLETFAYAEEKQKIFLFCADHVNTKTTIN